MPFPRRTVDGCVYGDRQVRTIRPLMTEKDGQGLGRERTRAPTVMPAATDGMEPVRM